MHTVLSVPVQWEEFLWGRKGLERVCSKNELKSQLCLLLHPQMTCKILFILGLLFNVWAYQGTEERRIKGWEHISLKKLSY